MSALEGFRAIWSHANAAFGQGTPSNGAQLDQSDRLQSLRDSVQSAGPDGAWTGSAADSYSEANSKQANTIGSIANLDKRLAAEVDRSASVVMAGRRDLENVRQWVNDAASRVQNTAAGDRQLYPVISKGSSDIQEILTRSHGDLSAIAGRIHALSGEYQALGEGEGGKAGKKLDKLPKTPDTTLDLDDIQYLDPKALGPSHYVDIGPGTWIPKNDFPGVAPSPPKAPLDYRDIEYLGPDVKGKSWQMELVPGSGAWVPNPSSPGFVQHPPEVPVDMATAAILLPGEQIPAGMVELYPGSRVAIPDPDANAPR